MRSSLLRTTWWPAPVVAALVWRAFAALALLASLLLTPSSVPLLAQTAEGEIDAASQSLYVPISDIVAVDAGYDHTCAITRAGGVKCWGTNQFGEAGNSTVTARIVPLPVDVTGLASGVKQVTAGQYFTCAVMTAGTVKCWGANDFGQLGNNGAVSQSNVPVDVPGLSGVASISAGAQHVCVVMSAGGVKCWGRGDGGQLGHGSYSGSAFPVDVTGLPSAAQQVSAGDVSTCVALKNGAAYCWGTNNFGQLGNNSVGGTTNKPGSVISSGVTSISLGGGHACEMVGAALACWGRNANGEAGNGTSVVNVVVPSQVIADGVAALDSGGATNCIIGKLGGAYCWGRGSDGQTGSGGRSDTYLAPGGVSGLQSGIVSISVGVRHACAVLDTGALKCWGDDSEGQLGNGLPLADQLTPADVLAPAVCYQLVLNRTGNGELPIAVDSSTPGCPPNHYLPGDLIGISASPAANQRVQSWSSPVRANSGDTSVVLKMPAADVTVTVAYAACNVLTLAHSGNGGDPLAAPSGSSGCSVGRFASGERVVLSAVPNAGQRVKSWAGASATPAVGSQVNSLTMPNGAATVTVVFEACFALTTSVAGQGDALLTAPTVSDGCLTGGFAAGQNIALVANPAAGWKVKSWIGTIDDTSTALGNSATMPANAVVVGVIYVKESEEEGVRVYLPTIGR